MSSDVDNFKKWYVQPLELLEGISHGGGGFVALSIGFMLCERWHRIESNERDDWKGEKFKAKAATYLNVDYDFFCAFWDVYRNGLQHQASPKWRKGDGGSRKPYGWLTHHSFTEKPQLGTGEDGQEYICINPFKFADIYLKLFLNDPAKLSDAVHHSFGKIGIINLNNITEVKPV